MMTTMQLKNINEDKTQKLSWTSIVVLLRMLVVLLLVSVLVLTIQALQGFSYKQQAYSDNYQNRMVPLFEVQRVGELMEQVRAQLLLALQHDPNNSFSALHDHPTSFHIDTARRHLTEAERLWSSFTSKPRGDEAAALANRYGELNAMLIQRGIDPVLQSLAEGNYQEANRRILFEVNPRFNEASAAQLLLSRRLLRGAEEAYEIMQSRSISLTMGMISTGVLSILITLVFSVYVTRTIRSGIKRVTHLANSMATGDLRNPPSIATKSNELTAIFSIFNETREQLNATVGSLTNSVSRVEVLAKEGAAQSADANRLVEKQKNETDMVAAAMNEMNVAVHEVAQNTDQAAHNARLANEQAKEGQVVLKESVQSMEALTRDVEEVVKVVQHLVEEANDIGNIVKVISEIADQTNLLALNAAIEAARAGEQGRGFAVVADEVRSLANRTQQSTQQINEMISRLQGSVDSAANRMGQSQLQAEKVMGRAIEAEEALQKIATLISSINDMNTQIASTAEEQGSVTEEMNVNIIRINDVADQTSVSSQRAESSSQETLKLAEELRMLVQRFKL
ncbi:methyl-accepting chemotaxis protein [Salinispirillum sp. LH 10-3-1]|uniref:Methyl-accepting chemotaxis protein n=1 Tax=Salinispirillum sp. LH 10-3-1 TaxID=2952525 RepID=A0AB38YCI1_9GAMM